jgi:hypothetical protein
MKSDANSKAGQRQSVVTFVIGGQEWRGEGRTRDEALANLRPVEAGR